MEAFQACESLGMPAPPPHTDPRTNRALSKRERLAASLSACRDEELPVIARAVLATQSVSAESLGHSASHRALFLRPGHWLTGHLVAEANHVRVTGSAGRLTAFT